MLLLVSWKEGFSTVVADRPWINTEHALVTVPFASLYWRYSYWLGCRLPGFVTEDRAKLKGAVVVAAAKRLVAVTVFPETEHETVPEQAE